MTPEELAYAKDKAAIVASPLLLGYYVLGYTDFCETQTVWDRWIREKIDIKLEAPTKTLVLQPRETFKTTYFTCTLAISILLNNPNASILIRTEVFGNAVDILREIKGHFESNTKFREHFGDWVKHSQWKAESIIVKKRKKHRKEHSIFVAGKGSALTGKHPDVIIDDDIAGDVDRDSKAAREETLRFFQRGWDLLNKQHGQYIMVGTRKHTKDIYNHVKDVLNPDLEDKFSILETPAHKVVDGKRTQELNFPRLLSEKKLKELRTVKMGSDGMDFATYESEYELNPLDPQTAIFKVFHYYNHHDCKYKYFVMATDPAISVKGTACYSAICVLGQIDGGVHNNRWGLAYCSVARREPSQVIKDHNRIYRMFYKKYGLELDVFMESNGFQQVLLDQAVAESLDEDGEIEVPTVGYNTTQNKDAKIRGLEPFISQGLLLFRDDHKTAEEGYSLAMEQFRQFPQAEKDAPDVIAVAHQKTRQWFVDEPEIEEKEETQFNEWSK